VGKQLSHELLPLGQIIHKTTAEFFDDRRVCESGSANHGQSNVMCNGITIFFKAKASSHPPRLIALIRVVRFSNPDEQQYYVLPLFIGTVPHYRGKDLFEPIE
jgi:hypothetical protein